MTESISIIVEAILVERSHQVNCKDQFNCMKTAIDKH